MKLESATASPKREMTVTGTAYYDPNATFDTISNMQIENIELGSAKNSNTNYSPKLVITQ